MADSQTTAMSQNPASNDAAKRDIQTTAKPTMEQIATAISFVQARVGATDFWFGPYFETAVHGWLPKLGSRVVRNSDDPPNGYPTELEAKAAARRYRDHCEAWLKEKHV